MVDQEVLCGVDRYKEDGKVVDDVDVEKLRSSEGPLARPSRMEEEIISGHYPPRKTSTPDAQVSMDDCSTCVEGQAEALPALSRNLSPKTEL